MAHRLRRRFRTKARYLVEGQFGAGGDHQVIVGQVRTVAQGDPFLGRMEPFGTLREEVDVASAKHLRQVNLHIVALAPAYCHPRV
ncbi:hypothetical protein D3C71_2116700 [compost metagenome]